LNAFAETTNKANFTSLDENVFLHLEQVEPPATGIGYSSNRMFFWCLPWT